MARGNRLAVPFGELHGRVLREMSLSWRAEQRNGERILASDVNEDLKMNRNEMNTLNTRMGRRAFIGSLIALGVAKSLPLPGGLDPLIIDIETSVVPLPPGTYKTAIKQSEYLFNHLRITYRVLAEDNHTVEVLEVHDIQP